MGSSFLKAVQEQDAYIEKLIQERDGGTPVSYSTLQAMGQLRPFTVRLPVTTLALVDKLQRYGLWSKQEMVYKMIQSAIDEYYEAADQRMRSEMDNVAKGALEAWHKRNKGRVVKLGQREYLEANKKRPRRRAVK